MRVSAKAGDGAEIRVGERGSVQIFGFAAPERWNVGLNPRVSYDLDVNLGAGEATLDLSRLDLTGGLRWNGETIGAAHYNGERLWPFGVDLLLPARIADAPPTRTAVRDETCDRPRDELNDPHRCVPRNRRVASRCRRQ